MDHPIISVKTALERVLHSAELVSSIAGSQSPKTTSPPTLAVFHLGALSCWFGLMILSDFLLLQKMDNAFP